MSLANLVQGVADGVEEGQDRYQLECIAAILLHQDIRWELQADPTISSAEMIRLLRQNRGELYAQVRELRREAGVCRLSWSERTAPEFVSRLAQERNR